MLRSKKFADYFDDSSSEDDVELDLNGVLCLKGQIFPLPHSTHYYMPVTTG